MSSPKSKAKAGPEALSSFAADAADHPDFRYIRYYWKQDGPKSGIASAILAKLTPAGHQAARHDLLLPKSAPGEYSELAHLLDRYDATQPGIERNGYAQFTIDLPADRPIHAGWEQIRAWVLNYFVRQFDLAAVMVLHIPFRAGSSNPTHIHILLPARRLGPNGFAFHARATCSDDGCKEALIDWQTFSKDYGWLAGPSPPQ